MDLCYAISSLAKNQCYNLVICIYKLKNWNCSVYNKKIIALNNIYFNETAALQWTLSNATENAISVLGEFPAHVDYYNPVTNTERQLVTLVISKVNGGFRINAEPTWGRTTGLSFNYLGDHFFGLSEPLQPNNQLSPDLTGSSINVDINSFLEI